jgi:hypothetical protein
MTTWHVTPEILVRYVRSPLSVDDVTAASVEQHLLACDECRATAAGAAAPTELDASWRAVADVIDRPRATRTEMVLARLGMPDSHARVVGATAGLRIAWLATMAMLATGAVMIGRRNGTEGLFLAVAPLLPLGSVLLTFLPTEEPGGEAAAATPLYGAGVVIRRALAALVPTFLILAGASVALPDLADGARWLLPGLALVLASLALSTYVRPLLATSLLAGGWVVLVTSVRIAERGTVPFDHTAVFGLRGQLLALGLAAASAVLLHRRRDRFSTLEVSW